MMTHMIWRKVGGVSLAISLFAVPATAQEVTLNALNFLPNNNSFGIPFAKWVEEVNAAGKGLVQIAIKPAGTMSPFVMGNAVKTGVVDMANVPPTFYQNLLPIGDSLKLARKGPAELRKNGTWDLMNKLHNEKVNAWFLGQWGAGAQFYLYLREKKIDSIDLKGMKLRVTPVYRSFFRTLGADLIQTAPADVYTALERGTIDGYGWPVWDIKSFGWDKVTKYRVEPGFYEVANAIIVNLDKWKTLSE
ncbi:MAG: ABC transporter substrate-binding protein, partial [Alphaproteobacteria bacterium]